MRALREIEQSLFADDPKFGSSVATEPGFSSAPKTGQLTMRSVALIVLGLVLLLGGVALASISTWTILLSVIGFAVMLFGGIMALRTPSQSAASSARASRQAKPRTRRSLNMEESFRRRFEDRQ